MKFGIFLCFFLATFWTSNCFYFEEQLPKTGLTFIKLSDARVSYDSYTMLYHLDIGEYKNLSKTVEKFISRALEFSDRIKGDNVINIIRHLKTELNHMKRDESDIEAYQQNMRKKRALEFVGSFLHWAFGLMDSNKAREYNEKINNLENGSSRFHNMLKEQTILIKEVIELNNQTYADFDKQLKIMYAYFEQYKISNEAHMKYIDTELIFSQGIMMAHLIATEHRRISEKILHCLEDIVTGKITQLIPKERILKDLAEIQSHLKENQKLPIDFNIENPLHIFKYSQVSASLYDNRLLLEVMIPIIEREVYTVYKIIPIPTLIENNTIIINPSSHYMLLNNQAEEYISISDREFLKAKFNLHGERIITPAENAHINYNDNCEIIIFRSPNKKLLSKYCDVKIIPTSNYFVSLNNNDMFYVQISKPILVTEYCHKKPSSFQEIKSSGLLQIDRECRVVTDKVSLRPRTNYRFDSRDLIMLTNTTQQTTFEAIFDKIKLIATIDIPKINDNVLIQDYTIDFNRLVDKADSLIEKARIENKWKDLEGKNKRSLHYSLVISIICSLIIIVLVVILVWYIYKKFFSIGIWIKLANVLGKKDVDKIPELFVRNVGLNVEHSNSSLIQVHNPNN